LKFHFIDRTASGADIHRHHRSTLDHRDENHERSPLPGAQAPCRTLLLCGDRGLLLIAAAERNAFNTSADQTGAPQAGGERSIMSKAYIIEVHNRTAGIVTADERGFSFFSSERAFDSLDGQHFASARDAERAARALLTVRGGRVRRAAF
jgi:hypothetical protein